MVQLSWKEWPGSGSGKSLDPSVYSGVLGTAFTCLRAYEATGNQQDLKLCAEIVDTCAEAARGSIRFIFIFNLLIFWLWIFLLCQSMKQLALCFFKNEMKNKIK